tara:strand:+ start:1752 stop:2042 length:291 start_codon:yes stop_codon:yes gene_type:complete
MFQLKSKRLNNQKRKSSLDHFLWLVENYLPQKKDRVTRKEFSIDNLEADTIRQFKKLASLRSKPFIKDSDNSKVTFTMGSWALPFLKILKRTGIIK